MEQKEGPPIQGGLQLVIYIDGASRGNPGMAAAGVYIINVESWLR